METRTKMLIKVLEDMERLVADNELYEIMEGYGFTSLVERIKQAEESYDPNLLFKIAEELQDFSIDVWSLAEKKGISYYAHDVVEVRKFFERDPQRQNRHNRQPICHVLKPMFETCLKPGFKQALFEGKVLYFDILLFLEHRSNKFHIILRRRQKFLQYPSFNDERTTLS